MKITVQTDTLQCLKEAVDSPCSGIRFGSEFCMYKIPSQRVLDKAYEITKDRGKNFTYVTPKLSNNALERVREHFALLNTKERIRIVVNDLGALNILRQYPSLYSHLGRQLIRVPARTPWIDRIIERGLQPTQRTAQDKPITYAKGDTSIGEWYKKVLSYTSLNYPPTIKLFQAFNVKGVDFSNLPRLYNFFDSLMDQGLYLSIHLHLVPIAVTRRCHTARFLGEKSPEECSKPCSEKAFMLKTFSLESYLYGNVVYTLNPPRREDIKKLTETNIQEIVITMSPVTGIDSRRKLDAFIRLISHPNAKVSFLNKIRQFMKK